MSDDDDEDAPGANDAPIPRLVPRRDSAPARRYGTASEADRVRELELLAAEWFGRDGDGGKLASMERTISEHDHRLDRHDGMIGQLSEFKGRILWLGGLAVTIGGAIAAIAFKLIDHALK